jgi:hypothetical protein
MNAKRTRAASHLRLSKAKLEELVEEATVDAYNESEQAVGFFTMIEDDVRLPFSTQVLGVEVAVEKFDVNAGGEIVAVCRRGATRQSISILELPLPSPPPEGAKWIEAYRYWRKGFR